MKCNYDLAGVPHNNDLRTCPECGYPNPLAGPPDPPAPKVAKSVAQSLCPTTLLFLLAMVADALQPKRHGTLNHFF